MARANKEPVAVVVFVNAHCAAAGDSINVAERAVFNAVQAASPRGDGRIVSSRAGRADRLVELGHIVELGRAVRAGLINLSTSPDAYTR